MWSLFEHVGPNIKRMNLNLNVARMKRVVYHRPMKALTKDKIQMDNAYEANLCSTHHTIVYNKVKLLCHMDERVCIRVA